MILQLFSTWLLAIGDDQGRVSVQRLAPDTVRWRSLAQDTHHQAVTALAWSNDGRYLASGSADTTIKVWDAVTGTVLQTYTGHGAAICALAWSPEGNRIASSAHHEGLHLWIPLLL
jgi:WD40 repeat protein